MNGILVGLNDVDGFEMLSTPSNFYLDFWYRRIGSVDMILELSTMGTLYKTGLL